MPLGAGSVFNDHTYVNELRYCAILLCCELCGEVCKVSTVQLLGVHTGAATPCDGYCICIAFLFCFSHDEILVSNTVIVANGWLFVALDVERGVYLLVYLLNGALRIHLSEPKHPLGPVLKRKQVRTHLGSKGLGAKL